MTAKKLISADNYFLFPCGGVQAVGVSKNGVCYRLSDSGELIPIAYGDEVASLYGEVIAVRRGQTVKTLLQ